MFDNKFMNIYNEFFSIIKKLNEERHKEIIKDAIVKETEYGLTCIASREDLIWMKRLRNSKQDIADIETLENEKDTENS